METIKIKNGKEYMIDNVGFQSAVQPIEGDDGEFTFPKEDGTLSQPKTDLDAIGDLGIHDAMFLIRLLAEDIVVPEKSGHVTIDDGTSSFDIWRAKNGYVEVSFYVRIGDYWGEKHWENPKAVNEWVICIVGLREIERFSKKK